MALTLTEARVQYLLTNINRSLNVITKTADYTMDGSEGTVKIDATSNAVTITLPASADVSGEIYNFKAINLENTVTIDGDGSETIDGSTTLVVSTLNDNVQLQSDGSNWIIL